jgi:hypothetical protein
VLRLVTSAALAVIAAVAWLVYERSLPVQIGPGRLLGDASSLAIGIGVFRLTRFVLAPRVMPPALPGARLH